MKLFDCLRSFKLNRIREVRMLRDELLFYCSNVPDAIKLLSDMPGLSRIEFGYADKLKSHKIIQIRIDDRTTYTFEGYNDFLVGLKDVGEFLYQIWIKNELAK